MGFVCQRLDSFLFIPLNLLCHRELCIIPSICGKMNAISAWSVALLCLLTTSGSTEAVSCILSKVPLKQRMCKCVMDGAPYAGQEIDLTPLSGRKL